MSRILVGEDSANFAFALSTSLEMEGHEVLVAETRPEGLEAAHSWNPDLIILDLTLPGLDGNRVLKALREEGGEVPVVILTARGSRFRSRQRSTTSSGARARWSRA